MAESGCLHNKKFKTIESTGDIDGKDIYVKTGHKAPQRTDVTVSSNRFKTVVAYSCGTDQGKFLNRSHYISSDLDLNKENRLYNGQNLPYTDDVLDLVIGASSSGSGSGANGVGYNFAVEGDAHGSSLENGRPEAIQGYYEKTYNNPFIVINDERGFKSALKQANSGIIKFDDTSNYATLSENQLMPEHPQHDFQYYVEWPPRCLLHDLIIIPNDNITFNKSGAYSGTADVQTQEMFERELTINLIQVNRTQISHISFTNGNYSENHPEDFYKYTVRETSDTTTEMTVGTPPLRGIIHRGKYKPLDRSCPYLIREFPIMAAPKVGVPTTWGKHTPIYAVRGGQPLNIHQWLTASDSDKQTYHQHETCRTTNPLRHGSLDDNPELAISKEHGSGGEADGGARTRNSANSTLRAKKSTDDPVRIIESTDFSYSHSKRRDGTQEVIDDFDPRFNALTRISTGMFNFNDPVRGRVANPISSAVETTARKPVLMKEGASGTFFNDSDTTQYLMLNIGQNSHYHTGLSSTSNTKDYDNTRSAQELTIGGSAIIPPESANNHGQSSDTQVNRRELDLRFKAIFRFKHIEN